MTYWCCKADFGEHEPTCKNYVAGDGKQQEARVLECLLCRRGVPLSSDGREHRVNPAHGETFIGPCTEPRQATQPSTPQCGHDRDIPCPVCDGPRPEPPSHESGEPGQDDGFMEWWLSVGIKEMPRGDQPPEHAAIARLAWNAMAEKAAQQTNTINLLTYLDALALRLKSLNINDPWYVAGNAISILQELYPPRSLAGAEPQPDERIGCMNCGKSVSSPVPKFTVVRAYVECPECIEKRGAVEPPQDKLRETVSELHGRARKEAQRFIRSKTLYPEYHAAEVAYETVLKLIDAESNRLEAASREPGASERT